MTINARQTQLLEAVHARGSATIEALAHQFDVTLQTVRRDVQKLAEHKLLIRYHGGVRSPSSNTENLAYVQRQQLNANAKRAMASEVARRIPDHCSIMINIGTTMEAVARALLNHKGLRVITNNLNVANVLSDNPECEVLVAPGAVRHRDKGIVGESTVQFISQFKVDIGLLGTSGIESDGTLRDYDFREVQVSRAILAHARQNWLVADHSKLGRPALVEVAQLQSIDLFLTDCPLPAPYSELIEQAQVECVVAQQHGDPHL